MRGESVDDDDQRFADEAPRTDNAMLYRTVTSEDEENQDWEEEDREEKSDDEDNEEDEDKVAEELRGEITFQLFLLLLVLF